MTSAGPRNTRPRPVASSGAVSARTPVADQVPVTPDASASARPKRLRRSGGRPDAAPLKYDGGQTAAQSVCIDWVRMTGPAGTIARVRELVAEYLGPATEGCGGYFLAESIRWGTAGLFFGSADPSQTHACLNLPASALREIGHEGTVRIIRVLSGMGWRSTRLDVALDFHEHAARTLIETMYRSCEHGELCHARRYQIIRETGQDGPSGHGINLGGRGKMGSGRYLRVYDKGLEQRSAPLGEWVRMEVEYTSDCAADAALRIAEKAKGLDDLLVGMVLGAVDFREANGRTSLEERPRVDWWDAIVNGTVTHRPVAVRPATTVSGYVRWVKRAVTPKLGTLAACTGLTATAVLLTMSGTLDPHADHLQDPIVRGLLTEYGIPLEVARANLESHQQLAQLLGLPS